MKGPRLSRGLDQRHKGRGQTLVEFALVVPLFLVLVMGIVEFAFMFNAILSVNFASRNASLIASEAGSDLLADCAILAGIETDIAVPLNKTNGLVVTVFKADRAGNAVQPVTSNENKYTRGTGSTNCDGLHGVTPYTLPYNRDINTYRVGEEGTNPNGDRCDILAGCSATVPLDLIGVKVEYRYYFQTPIRNLVSFLPGASGGYLDISWTNVTRMEPIL